jgi:hypothetical protein
MNRTGKVGRKVLDVSTLLKDLISTAKREKHGDGEGHGAIGQ